MIDRYIEERTERSRAVIRVWNDRYGPPEPPAKRNPLTVLIVTILSQNTTDTSAFQAYENLLDVLGQCSTPEKSALPYENGELNENRLRMAQAADAYPDPDFSTLRSLTVEEIAEPLSVCGLYNQKAATIKRAIDKAGGQYDLRSSLTTDDELLQWLTSIKGVGTKTAYVVATECGYSDRCPVDTHVHRIAQRLRLVEPGCTRSKAHDELHELLPDGERRSFHHGAITFGRERCTAQTPNCDECPLFSTCGYPDDPDPAT